MIVRISSTVLQELYERYSREDDAKDDPNTHINRAIEHINELMGLTNDPWPDMTGDEFNDEQICKHAVGAPCYQCIHWSPVIQDGKLLCCRSYPDPSFCCFMRQIGDSI